MRFSPYAWKQADMVGGDPALDFINTASAWASEPVDRLGGMEGLANWALIAGVLDPAGCAALKDAAATKPVAATQAFDDAIKLRASLWRVFGAAAAGRFAEPRDLQTLRNWSAAANEAQELVETPAGFSLVYKSDTSIFVEPIYKLALGAEKLLLSAPLERLHACGGDGCEWLFLDTSKNASRRWCSMSTCGNGAKVRKFRKRMKSG